MSTTPMSMSIDDFKNDLYPVSEKSKKRIEYIRSFKCKFVSKMHYLLKEHPCKYYWDQSEYDDYNYDPDMVRKKCVCNGDKPKLLGYLTLSAMDENYSGCFHIPNEKIHYFFELYVKLIKKYSQNQPFNFLEVQKDEAAFVVDFDFRKTVEEGTTPFKLITDDQVNEVVFLFQDVVRKYVVSNVSEKFPHFRIEDCLILTKEPRLKLEKNELLNKHGVHLHFLNLYMKKDDREKLDILLRYEMKQHFPHLLPDYDNALKNPWLLYGSVKNSTSGCFKVDRIVTSERKIVTHYDYYINKKILKTTYDAGQEIYKSKDENILNDGYILLETKEEVDENLPRILLLGNREIQVYENPYWNIYYIPFARFEDWIGGKRNLKDKSFDDNLDIARRELGLKMPVPDYLKRLQREQHDFDISLSSEDEKSVEAIAERFLAKKEISEYFKPRERSLNFRNGRLYLDRISCGKCLIDGSEEHSTRPAYLTIFNGSVFFGCCDNNCKKPDGKKLLFIGKFKTSEAGWQSHKEDEDDEEFELRQFLTFNELFEDEFCKIDKEFTLYSDKLQNLLQKAKLGLVLSNKTSSNSVNLVAHEIFDCLSDYTCPVSKEKHLKTEGYPYLFLSDNGLLHVCCKMCETKDGSKSKCLGKFIHKFETNEEFNENFEGEGRALISSIFETKISPQIIEEKYVRVEHLMSPEKCVVVQSQLGSGKTTSSINYIDQLPNSTPIIFLTPRRSYAVSFHQRVNSENKSGKQFALYMNEKLMNITKKHIIIQAESLHRLNIDFSGCCVVIDEIESFLTQLTSSGTHQNHIKSINVLAKMLSSASKVLMFDAFISSKTIDFCLNFGLTTKFFKYVYEQDKRIIQRVAGSYNKTDDDEKIEVVKRRTDNRDYFLNSLYCDLKNGKKIYLFCSSNSFLVEIEKFVSSRLPEIKLLSYHSQSTNRVVDAIEEWSKVDLVLTTSTITVGINFDLHDYFDRGYIFVSAVCKNLVRDVFQSLYRVRRFKENFFVLCLDERSLGCSLGTHPVEKRLIKENVEFLNTEFLKIYKQADLETPMWLSELLVSNQLERNLSIHYLKIFFEKMASASGYKFTDEEDLVVEDDTQAEDVPQLETEIDEMELDDDNEIEYKDIPYPFDDIRALKLKRLRGQILTELEKLILAKNTFKDKYLVSPDAIKTEQEHVLWMIFTGSKFKKNKLRLLQIEKTVRENPNYLNSFIDVTKHSVFQQAILTQLQHLMKMTEILKMSHTQDENAEITRENMLKYGTYLSENKEVFDSLKKAYSIKIEGKVNFENIKFLSGLINQLLHEIGYTELKAEKQKTKIINGKRTTVSNFTLIKSISVTNRKYSLKIDEYLEKDPSFNPYVMIETTCPRKDDDLKRKIEDDILTPNPKRPKPGIGFVKSNTIQDEHEDEDTMGQQDDDGIVWI